MDVLSPQLWWCWHDNTEATVGLCVIFKINSSLFLFSCPEKKSSSKKKSSALFDLYYIFITSSTPLEAMTKHTHLEDGGSKQPVLAISIPSTAQLRMSYNRHSQFNHITLKKCYTNQRRLWQHNIIPQLQLITHTSSPCIPFTYLNKDRGSARKGNTG